MSNNFFKFKQFKIQQEGCAMKVGTDGVLLGSWCSIENREKVLDIGSGTGLISLMIAQRNKNSIIDSIEIDKEASIQSEYNVENSPWKDRISIKNTSLQDFISDSKYDLIVSNPPFFENSIKNRCSQKTMARHTDSLSFEDLIIKSKSLLNTNGIISIIYPYLSDNRISAIVDDLELQFIRKTIVKGNENSSPKRVLAEISFRNDKNIFQLKEDVLVIEKERHIYTEEYIELTKEFYLQK